MSRTVLDEPAGRRALRGARPPPASSVVPGVVVHRRLRPVSHAFSYRVLSMLIDLDELPDLDRRSALFGHNRRRVVSFLDRDHGPRDGSPLRPWVEGHLALAGIDIEDGPVRILCSPRILGYVFNPLSVWFCHHRDGSLRAVLYEVRNTFGEYHNYLIPVDPDRPAGAPVRQSCRKQFPVSPFMPMDLRYRFHVREPDDRIAVSMRLDDADGAVFVASWRGERRPFTAHSLRRALAANPLSTVKVIAGIHWEAVRLWRKRVPLHPRPQAPAAETSYVQDESATGLRAGRW